MITESLVEKQKSNLRAKHSVETQKQAESQSKRKSFKVPLILTDCDDGGSTQEESMGILKEFITKHNVPNDVPDELLEGSSDDDDEEDEDEDEVAKKSKGKPKKPKIN
ncbi:hypothetical protein V6N12_059097 [Hibiscus sabdariffa]|uniref:Uncharacterized protein n=1 Tax=Hibiscus sabdariffa TaxID=183260 RepID=A0ABR2EU28_9ROSI